MLRIDDDKPLVIGRGKDVAGHIDDPRVSRTHCQVQVEGGELVLLDRGSTGGTFVNGEKINQHVLQPGDVIRIGETELQLPGDPAAEEEEPQLKPVSSIMDAGLGAPGALAASASVKKLTDLVGQTLAAYKLVHVLAPGRTGLVFHAEDTRHGGSVALKVLKEEFSKDEKKMQRFVRAMKTMLPVRHPNLIAVLNAGKTGPYCWIAMEFVDGQSLTQFITQRGFGGMIDWPAALRVAVHVARGLQYAHQQQIIHRAVTPQNILLEEGSKQAKLGDLMLAKALEGTQARAITNSGELLGDIDYMSPERTHGTTDVDARSDLYSLGATTYALLAGRPPFTGNNLVETIAKIRKSEPAGLKQHQAVIPDRFEAIVRKMLAKRPPDRYQSTGELLEALEQFGKAMKVPLD